MKKTALFAALCTLGTLMALPVSAHDSDRGRRQQWSQHRDHDRHWGHERRSRHFNRHERYERHSPRWRHGRSHYAPHGRYCRDSRHFHGAHYHFAPRDYYGHDYSRQGYRRHGVYGPDASLIVTLPLF